MVQVNSYMRIIDRNDLRIKTVAFRIHQWYNISSSYVFVIKFPVYLENLSFQFQHAFVIILTVGFLAWDGEIECITSI